MLTSTAHHPALKRPAPVDLSLRHDEAGCNDHGFLQLGENQSIFINLELAPIACAIARCSRGASILSTYQLRHDPAICRFFTLAIGIHHSEDDQIHVLAIALLFSIAPLEPSTIGHRELGTSGHPFARDLQLFRPDIGGLEQAQNWVSVRTEEVVRVDYIAALYAG